MLIQARCSEMGFSSNFRLRFSISIKITDSESASKIKNLNQRNFFSDPIFFPASPLPAGFPVLPVSNYRFIFSHTRVSTRRVGCHWNFENRNSGSNFMNFFRVRDFCEIFLANFSPIDESYRLGVEIIYRSKNRLHRNPHKLYIKRTASTSGTRWSCSFCPKPARNRLTGRSKSENRQNRTL